MYASINIYVDAMMRTTIMLREDVYESLLRTFGKRNLSEGINQYLVERIFGSRKKSMFGSDRWLQKAGSRDLREHDERDL